LITICQFEDEDVSPWKGNVICQKKARNERYICKGKYNFYDKYKFKINFYTEVIPYTQEDEKTGYGTMINRCFGKYLIRLEIKKKGKKIHSFRYTVSKKKVYEHLYQGIHRSSYSHELITMGIWREKNWRSYWMSICK